MHVYLHCTLIFLFIFFITEVWIASLNFVCDQNQYAYQHRIVFMSYTYVIILYMIQIENQFKIILCNENGK